MSEAVKKRILDICPVCGFEFVDAPGIVILLSTYVLLNENNQPQPSFPKLLCTNCGIEFFSKQLLEQIKANSGKEAGRIVLANPGMKFN